MKKIILAALVTTSIYAQDCKFKRNEFDSFTKEKVVETKSKPIVDIFSPTQTVSFQFLYDKKAYITITIDLVNYQTFTVGTEDKILFLLQNDEVLTLNSDTGDLGEHMSTAIGSITRYNRKFEISVNDIKKIRSIGIRKIRFENPKENKNFDVNNQNKIEKMNSIIDCFLNAIPKQE